MKFYPLIKGDSISKMKKSYYTSDKSGSNLPEVVYTEDYVDSDI